MKPIQEWSDSFGKQVSNTNNALDLPGHYTLNPERYRVRENGTRVQIRDTTFVQDDQEDFLLQPGPGNSVALYTAERPRYVVNYESEASFAFRATEDFTSNDVLQIGLRDYRNDENKIFYEFTQGPSVDVVVEKAGTELERKTIDLPEKAPGFKLTNPTRPYITYNWYGVGPYDFGISYTDETAEPREQQYNKILESISIPDQTSTEEANLNLFFEFTQGGSSTTNIEAGSCGLIIRGTPQATTRAKAARFVGLPYGGSGNYEPVMAIRVDPERENVFSEVNESEIIFDNGDGELLITSVNPSLTDADFITDPTGDGVTTGPVSPPQHNSANSVIQYTTDVTTFPNQSGAEVTDGPDPGGYQISFSTSDAPATGGGGARASSNLQRKRPLHNDQIGVFLVKRDTSNSTTVNIIFETEQDW